MMEKLDTACQTASSYAQKTCTMKTEAAKFIALKDSKTVQHMENVFQISPFSLPSSCGTEVAVQVEFRIKISREKTGLLTPVLLLQKPRNLLFLGSLISSSITMGNLATFTERDAKKVLEVHGNSTKSQEAHQLPPLQSQLSLMG